MEEANDGRDDAVSMSSVKSTRSRERATGREAEWPSISGGGGWLRGTLDGEVPMTKVFGEIRAGPEIEKTGILFHTIGIKGMRV